MRYTVPLHVVPQSGLALPVTTCACDGTVYLISHTLTSLLALAPNDLHRTGSAEPRTTPFPPPPFMPQQACITGSTRHITPHPHPPPLTRTEHPN